MRFRVPGDGEGFALRDGGGEGGGEKGAPAGGCRWGVGRGEGCKEGEEGDFAGAGHFDERSNLILGFRCGCWVLGMQVKNVYLKE